MGRPPACDCRCGGDERPEPPVTDCENLLCIVFMDENSPGIPDAKMQGFIDAFPNRVLIVLDVYRSGPPFMTYTTKFNNYNRAFSLRQEYDSDPTDLIRFIQRDNGLLSVAEENDPWGRIKEILDRNGLTTWLDEENKEVSIFIDNSGSMRASQVAATVTKLENDLEADGKTRTESISNTAEDIICPFVVSECCTEDGNAEILAGICGYTWECPEYVNVNFVNPPFLYQDYEVKIAEYNETYTKGQSVTVEVGTTLTFQLTSTASCPGGIDNYGPWRGRTPATAADGDEVNDKKLGATCQGHSVATCLCDLQYTIPSGGLDIWPEISCIYA